MGLGKIFRPITAAVNRAHEIVDNLEDQVDHWRDVAAREHDRRVEGLANAEIAIAEAKANTAIIKAESQAAAVEAEARGVALGSVQGYQRALDETDMFDAGFENGRKRRESMSNAQRSTRVSVSGSQAKTQGPPTSLGNKQYMTERGSTSTRTRSRTRGSSTPTGTKQFVSDRSGRTRDHPPSADHSGKQPSYHGPESKKQPRLIARLLLPNRKRSCQSKGPAIEVTKAASILPTRRMSPSPPKNANS